MKVGGGAQKGAQFERDVCVRLSLWVSGGKRRDLFWRSAMSGGRATVAFKRGQRLDRQAGDICAIDPAGHDLTDRYFFECKFRRDIGLVPFMLDNTGPLAEWWRDACRKAAQHEREPVVIAKENRLPAIVITQIGSRFDRHPIAVLKSRGCILGMLARVLRGGYG